MSERSDLFVMAQGISNVNAFRSGMRPHLAAPMVSVNVEGKTTAVFKQNEELQQAAA